MSQLMCYWLLFRIKVEIRTLKQALTLLPQNRPLRTHWEIRHTQVGQHLVGQTG